MNPTDFQLQLRAKEAVDNFLGQLEGRCLPSTVKRYNAELTEFLRFIGGDFPAEYILMQHCESYLTRKWQQDKGAKTKAMRWTVLNQFFTYLDIRDYIPENPMRKIPYPKVPPAEDRGVKSMSLQDVQKMFGACENWTEKLCIGILAYMGVRRKAANNLRWKDVDLELGYMTFKEKGQKTIRKPIPLPLLELLKAYSLSEGLPRVGSLSQSDAGSEVVPPSSGDRGRDGARVHGRETESSRHPSLSDYVIPSEAKVRGSQRNDRFIWKVVKRVGERAGVDTHCHAFRAAFAVHYLESHDNDTIGLQELMGHNHFETTKGYLKRLNKQKAMERVRDLDWGVSLTPAEDRNVDGCVAHHPGMPSTADSALVPPLASAGVSEDDSERHNDDEISQTGSMTSRLLRGKDSNLDSTILKDSSGTQRTKLKDDIECRPSKSSQKRTT